MAGAAASPAAGHVVERFRSRLREEAGGGEPGAAAVVHVYAEALRELTFNCKPVITELTIIAGQHATLAAGGIADAICARVAEVVPPDQILPSLYLLDSIVKNIGGEYVEHFATRLRSVFVDAYYRVHPNQYTSMRRLFRTWWPVFPSSVLRSIEDDLQFSSSENNRPTTSTNLHQTESLSPRPSHGIHVNPKYLEAQHKFKQANVVHQPAARDTRQMTDVQEDLINGLASNSSCERPSIFQYADDPDQQETFRPLAGTRAASPHLLSTHASDMNLDGPLVNSRRNLSISPPLDVFSRNVSPKRALERLPPSHSVLGPDPRKFTDRNGRLRWGLDDGAQRPTISMLDEEYRKQSARELIDAYGNCQGRDADERLPKVQRLDPNGMASRSSARNWLTSEEEEYSWEDMSPTLTDRVSSSMPSFPPGTMRTGFPGANAGLLESDVGRHNFPSQATRLSVDGSPFNLEDRFSTASHVNMSTRRYPSNFGVQNGALLKFQNSEHALNHGRIATMPAPPWQQPTGLPLQMQAPQHSSALDRLPQPADSEMPVKRLDIRGTYNGLNVDRSLAEKHRSSPARAPTEWLPLHHTPSQTLPLIIPETKHVRSASDSLEISSFVSQGASSSVFVPHHQYDALDRKTGTRNLAQPPYQHQDLLLPSQQNQGTILGNQVHPHLPQQLHPHSHPHHQETFRSFAPGMTVSPFQGQGGNATMTPVSVLPTFSVPPAVPPYGVLSAPGFPMPPLPPGPPPVPLQMGSSSSQVGGPQPFVSGLLSNLMRHGVISLEPPSQSQDSVGVDFNVDLKVRNEPVINALYQDLSRQCKTCGLRFKCQEEHRAHMDWHVTKNRNSKNRKQSSRKYFVTVEEWLRAAETVGNDGVPAFVPSDPVPDRKEEREIAVPADEEQTACALCQEPFEDFYSDETDEWMYRGAVYMNAPDGNIDGLERSRLGPIVHAKCRSGPSNT
ncbi:polyadenylation and cleavage factor homolog 4 isoform X3 [Zea mays]|uniref:polyadenylation and cleavage factor homolog 4 isoform X3 n=1 Tax=Zea mays TaxID=4577 RepID=UPI000C6C5F13|nr:polyadenylation and cleavage factor homolog 4 isoform X3 [Zea mays]|eukprot:XP_023158107.1 polyadenylation and cleavage factor homolog 4 isoform X3 [Zea mays]